MKKAVLVFILSLFFACKKQTNQNSSYVIDLSVMYDRSMNLYRIDIDGNTVILMNEKNEIGKLYKSKLDKTEIDSIQKDLVKISQIKCDSTTNHYEDGINYKLIITNQQRKSVFISNTCKNYELVDKMVLRIINKFKINNKIDFFESTIPLPPPLPEVEE